jgi:hypothetical protein
MITDCWLPPKQCKAAHIFPRKLKSSFSDVIGGQSDINDVRNCMLWANAIETAFSNNEACLMYNPLQQKLMFFLLNPALSDLVVCRNQDHTVRFSDIDGKSLDIDVGQLPRLRLLAFHANAAIDQTRKCIDVGLYQAPRHWNTLETLQTITSDAAQRLCENPSAINENSPDYFAKSLESSDVEFLKRLQNSNSMPPDQLQVPFELFSAPDLEYAKAKSGSQTSASTSTYQESPSSQTSVSMTASENAAALNNFLEDIKLLQSQSAPVISGKAGNQAAPASAVTVAPNKDSAAAASAGSAKAAAAAPNKNSAAASAGSAKAAAAAPNKDSAAAASAGSAKVAAAARSKTITARDVSQWKSPPAAASAAAVHSSAVSTDIVVAAGHISSAALPNPTNSHQSRVATSRPGTARLTGHDSEEVGRARQPTNRAPVCPQPANRPKSSNIKNKGK